MKTFLIVTLAALALVSSSCTFRLADLSAVSTRNVNIHGVDLDKLPGRKVEGVSSRPIVLIFPIGLPSLEEAVDDALDLGEGDLLLDCSIYRRSSWFVLGGSEEILVKGTVVSTRGAASSGAQSGGLQ